MDLYTYLCLKGIIKKIKSNFISKICEEFPEEPVSDITWLTKFNKSQYAEFDDIVKTLEDPRNCTMITGNRIDKVLGADFNLSFIANSP